MKTKTQRIKHARNLVSELYPFWDQWRFNYWPDGLHQPGRESRPDSYASAMSARADVLIRIANEDDTPVYHGGRWVDYVKS